MSIEIQQVRSRISDTENARITDLTNADRNAWERISPDDLRGIDKMTVPWNRIIRLVAIDTVGVTDSHNSIVGTAWLAFQGLGSDMVSCKLDVVVDPSLRRRGIGSKLYEASTEIIRLAECSIVEGDVRSDDYLKFVKDRGYLITHHSLHFVRNLQQVDAPVVDQARESLKSTGLRFCDLSELKTDTDYFEKLERLNERAGLNEAGAHRTFHSMSELRGLIANRPREVEGFFVFSRDALVGMAFVQYPHPSGSEYAYNRIAGVDPDFRGMGIGTCLKLMTVEHAQKAGAKHIWGAVLNTNAANIQVNLKTGYEQRGESYHIKLELPKGE